MNNKKEIIENLEEFKYLELITKIINLGSLSIDRTKIGTKSLFGESLRFSLENNVVPVITTKKMFLKGIVEELLFFLRGNTNTKILEEKGINIWKGNTSREFLDKQNLKNLPEGSMGKGYGFQWRNFNGTTNLQNLENWKSSPDGIDQIANLINSIKNDPYGRRHVISAWNPPQLNETPLVPCHCFIQFHVDNGKLSCQWYQRSVDTFLGLPFNILSYALLTRIIAKITSLESKELIFVGGNVHIYNNHLKQIEKQLIRVPYKFPTLNINKSLSSIKDIENLQFSDFEFIDYKYHPSIKAEMAI